MKEGHPVVLAVDDDPSQLRLIERWLHAAGHFAVLAGSAEQARGALQNCLPDAILLDLHLGDSQGLQTLEAIRRAHPRVPVLMLTAERDLNTAVAAMQAGAWDYLTKPVERTRLLTTLRNAVERRRLELRLDSLERQAGGGYPHIVGRSPPLTELFRQMDRVARSDVTVLVQGESGTGKELVARALHETSPRRGRPFVAVNCGAIAEGLQESELFGHEKGAFTGATRRHEGRFEQAHTGTLFLDEVAELSPALQARLLRALQERRFYRVGGQSEVQVDLRIISATHRDLLTMVRAGAFRQDLYYRLAVFELSVPPLRERGDDVLLLARAFLEELAPRHGLTPPRLEPEAEALLLGHGWPGNVRELRNAMERAIILSRDGLVRAADLPAQLRPSTVLAAAPEPGIEAAPRLDEVERRAIEEAMEACQGNLSEVVRRLGIPRSTLYRRLKDYGLR